MQIKNISRIWNITPTINFFIVTFRRLLQVTVTQAFILLCSVEFLFIKLYNNNYYVLHHNNSQLFFVVVVKFETSLTKFIV